MQLVATEAPTGVGEIQESAPSPAGITECYPAAEADQIAAEAAMVGTRHQYASIYRSFTKWLAT